MKDVQGNAIKLEVLYHFILFSILIAIRARMITVLYLYAHVRFRKKKKNKKSEKSISKKSTLKEI